jgi:hypothetical protein
MIVSLPAPPCSTLLPVMSSPSSEPKLAVIFGADALSPAPTLPPVWNSSSRDLR